MLPIKEAPADRKKVFAFIGFRKVVGVAAVVVVAAAAAVAGTLVSFSSVNRASKAENAKKRLW